MSIPPWLFDELPDDDLVARAEAWAGLLNGAAEIDGAARDRAHGWTVERVEFITRYHELRAQAVGAAPFDEVQHTGFWKRVVSGDAA